MVVGAEHARGLSREEMLGRLGVVEADREGVDPAAEILRHHRDDKRTIDAARKKRAERHIALEALLDGAAHELAQPRLRILGRQTHLEVAARLEAEEGPALPAALGEVDRDCLSRVDLGDALVDREFRRHVLDEEIRRDRVARDLPLEEGQRLERLQLAREREVAVAFRDVERLLPERIARKDQLPLPRVPRGEGEHPREPRALPEVAGLEHVAEDLGVAHGAEHMALALEFGAQRTVVVDLAVEDDLHRAVLVRHRLPPLGPQVDDREAAVRERNHAVVRGPGRAVIGAAVHHRVAHRGRKARDLVAAKAESGVDDACDAAHVKDSAAKGREG